MTKDALNALSILQKLAQFGAKNQELPDWYVRAFKKCKKSLLGPAYDIVDDKNVTELDLFAIAQFPYYFNSQLYRYILEACYKIKGSNGYKEMLRTLTDCMTRGGFSERQISNTIKRYS